MIIRLATAEDVPAILEIYNEAVRNTTATADYEPHTLEMRQAWFAERQRDGYLVFVAETEAREIVGWSCLNRYKDRIGYRFTAETSVYVAAESRGQGLGKALLPPLIEAAHTLNLHTLVAAIDSANEASIRLHAAFGFRMVGVLHESVTKFGHWLDVVYMELLLG